MKYTIWIASEAYSSGAYIGEIGAIELSQDQINAYFSFSGKGDIAFNKDFLAQQCDQPSIEGTSLPSWDTITDGSVEMAYGPYADQVVGVCRNGEEEPVFSSRIEDLIHYHADDIENASSSDFQESITPCVCITDEFGSPAGVWMFYNSMEKGQFLGTFELPDEESFNPKLLLIHTREFAGNFPVVTGIAYNSVDIEFQWDADGKGVDWYIFHNDGFEQFK